MIRFKNFLAPRRSACRYASTIKPTQPPDAVRVFGLGRADKTSVCPSALAGEALYVVVVHARLASKGRKKTPVRHRFALAHAPASAQSTVKEFSPITARRSPLPKGRTLEASETICAVNSKALSWSATKLLALSVLRRYSTVGSNQ